jgi:hypothetical protein
VIRRAVTGGEEESCRYTIANDFTSPLRGPESTVSHPASGDAQPRALLPVIHCDDTIAPLAGQQSGRAASPRRRIASWPVAAALLALTVACQGSPADQSSASGPPTAARQTAEVAVRQISAGNRDATPTPAPTAVPPPACAGAVWWYEASAHVGQSLAVQGRVVHAHPAVGSVRLDLGQSYPDPTGLPVLVRTDLGVDRADATWAGKMICVHGRVESADPGAIVSADSADAIEVLP